MEEFKSNRNANIIATAYVETYEDLKRFLLTYTHNQMDAEDMLQNVFLKLMTMDVLVESTLRHLIFHIARQMIINDARHKQFVRRSNWKYREVLTAYDNDSPAILLQAKELAESELHILSIMSDKRARVYRMYRHDDLSAREIALQLQLSQRTVETHIYMSTKEMRAKLREII